MSARFSVDQCNELQIGGNIDRVVYAIFDHDKGEHVTMKNGKGEIKIAFEPNFHRANVHCHGMNAAHRNKATYRGVAYVNPFFSYG